MESLQKQIKQLQDQVQGLQVRRVYQWDVAPGIIKTRHMGEANSYFVSGLAADRPTEGITITGGVSYYWATDTGVLSIWTGTGWLSGTFS